MAEDLSRLLLEAKRCGDLKGVVVTNDLTITKLFLNDILLFFDGSRIDIVVIKSTLSLFERAIDKVINLQKYSLSEVNLSSDELVHAQSLFPFHMMKF